MNDIKSIMDSIVKKYKKAGVIGYDDLMSYFFDNQLTEDDFNYIWKRLSGNRITVQMKEEETGIDNTEIDADDEELEEIEEEIKELQVDNSSDYTDDSTRMYIREAGSKPLLTAEEEVELAKKIEEGRKSAEKIITERGKLIKEKDNKKKGQIQKNIDKLQKKIDEGESAKEELITCNLRLVINIAKHYLGGGLQLLDLIQEGNLGLIRASERYDYKRGFKFSTYATWWIRQAITRGLADQGRTIRIPVHMNEMINRIKRAQKKLTMTLSREPSEEELAAETDLPLDKVREAKKYMGEVVSLDMTIGEDDDSVLGNFICDESTPDPQDCAITSSMSTQLNEVLNRLTPRERAILIMRFGLNDDSPMTLEEVGKVFHVTRERIRQIEGKGLRKLRKYTNRKFISDYLH